MDIIDVLANPFVKLKKSSSVSIRFVQFKLVLEKFEKLLSTTAEEWPAIVC